MLKDWRVAGFIAGLVVFLWGAIAHMALGLGDSAIRQLPQEETLLAALGEKVKEPGMYFFPYFTDMSKMDEMYAKYPHGLLFYSSAGTKFNFVAALVRQLIFDVVGMLIAAWLLWKAAPAIPGFPMRVVVVVAMGLFAFFSTDAPYWNWYEFPARFTLDGLTEKLAATAFGGAVLAYLLGRRG